MSESYSHDDGSGARDGASAHAARTAIEHLLPGVDASLLLDALAAERAGTPAGDDGSDPAALELRRVRLQFALGEALRASRHELNNPLTALLAEAQLLELEAPHEEHRLAAGRIVALARRIVAVTKRLEGVGRATIG